MDKPKFNNRRNEHLIIYFNDGVGNVLKRDIWVSRAPAVVGIVFAFGVVGGDRVLTIKRSKNMREEPNKYGAPSGYLDFNETGHEGMIREVYEETSMYLPYYEPFLIFDNDQRPFYIQDDPKKDKNQNISLTYVQAYDFYDHQDMFPQEIENYSNYETESVSWLKLSEVNTNNMEWAFNHNKRIEDAYEFFHKNYRRK